MDAFDAVVVGAGMNGLAAAVHLLSRGWSVAVIEQAAEPGGAVKTREITLPGFRHDLCAMNLSLFAGSPFFAAYKEELTAQGLAFAPAADCFASVFRDHGFLGVSKDLDKTLAAHRRAVGQGRRGLADDGRPFRRGSPAPLRSAWLAHAFARVRFAQYGAPGERRAPPSWSISGGSSSRPRAISSTPISKSPR